MYTKVKFLFLFEIFFSLLQEVMETTWIFRNGKTVFFIFIYTYNIQKKVDQREFSNQILAVDGYGYGV